MDITEAYEALIEGSTPSWPTNYYVDAEMNNL